MDDIVLYYGYHPEQNRKYQGEHIYKVLESRCQDGIMKYYLEHGGWIKETGPDKYQTDWCAEERWARAVRKNPDETETLLGFIIAVVDRSEKLL